MFNFFKSGNLKGFKVCKNEEQDKKYGIAADSLEKLKEKVKEKFKVEKFDFYFNGSLIIDDDYFNSLPNQSLIIIVNEGDVLKTGKYKRNKFTVMKTALFLDYDIMLDLFRMTFEEAFHARDLIKEFIKSNDNKDMLRAVTQIHNEIDEKTKASGFNEHEQWFMPSDSKKTKEEVMRIKARDRIKGYFYKTKDELSKSLIYRSNARGRKIIDDLLDDFFIFLNSVEYFECLFDRSHEKKFTPAIADEIDARAIVKRRRIDAETKIKIKENSLFEDYAVSLCNELGYFDCHGIWNADKCNYSHRINPYASRESLILFQIFNLDHQIEISRSIFPSILKNVEKLCEDKEVTCDTHKKQCKELSVITYFLEIFTIKNLKLVHIVCHDKGTHADLESNGKLICENCKESKLLRKFKARIN